MTEDDLEARLRAALTRRARQADVSAVTVARVVPPPGRGRRHLWVVPLAAAGVALAVGAGVVVPRVLTAGEPESVGGPDQSSEVLDTSGWRTEQWRDLAVDVPATWGWGGAPMAQGRRVVSCLASEVLGPDGLTLGRRVPLGYVGRPITLSDMCVSGTRGIDGATPYVWLGAAVEPGTVDLGDGFVQETREVAGSTVTVGSDDSALRDAVLASARAGGPCAAELPVTSPLPTLLDDDMIAFETTLRVCVYARVRPADDTAMLTYAAHLGPSASQAYESAIGRSRARSTCDLNPEVMSEWVVIQTMDGDNIDRRDLVQPGCATIERGARSLSSNRGGTTLTMATEAPWSTGPASGVRGVLRYFIGILG